MSLVSTGPKGALFLSPISSSFALKVTTPFTVVQSILENVPNSNEQLTLFFRGFTGRQNPGTDHLWTWKGDIRLKHRLRMKHL